MKLAYIVSLFPKLSETFILRELVELDARGHDLTIVSLKGRREPLEHEEARALLGRTLYPSYGWPMLAAAIRCLALRPAALAGVVARIAGSCLSRPGLLLRSLALVPPTLVFARQLERKGVTHVHAHWATWPALCAWIVSRVNRVPYSVTAHAHDLLVPNPMLPIKVAESRFFATISEHNRALLIQKCGPAALAKLRLIRCGLPLGDFVCAPRPPDRSRPPRLVSVGRLVDYKGFDVLIRACARLRDGGRPARCLIIGDGPERERLLSLVTSLRLGDLVTLQAGMRQPEVSAAIAGADLFVLACVPGRDGLQDGIPIVLMEAMALGVPVVSTKLSGIPELVEDHVTGLLAAPGDDAHLAAVIARLIEDPALAETMIRAARARVEKEYDIRLTVSRLVEGFGRPSPSAGEGSS